MLGSVHYKDFNACSKDTLKDLVMETVMDLFSVFVLLFYTDTYKFHYFFNIQVLSAS